MKQLDEKDEKIADVLISLGMSRPVAKTLSYLQHVDEATSAELERGTGLRQPEVSIAMRELKARHWVNEREKKKAGKGRPYKIYTPRVSLTAIIAHLEEQKIKEDKEMQSKIKRLKELKKESSVS